MKRTLRTLHAGQSTIRSQQSAIDLLVAGFSVLLVAIWTLCLPAPIQAQVPVDFEVGWIDFSQHRTASLAWGDMDGDGDLDVIAGNYDDVTLLFENDGEGVFESRAALGTQTRPVSSVAWGDMDGDGDLDLAVGNVNRPNQIFRNEGYGAFVLVEGALGIQLKATSCIVWGDVDADGDLDLAVGNDGQPNQLFRNEGGAFTEVTGTFGTVPSATVSLDWGDMDGDGDLDLAVGNEGEMNQIYRNDGLGIFSEVTGALGSDASETRSVAWGDVDGDGDLDLAVGNEATVNRLYRNDGGGHFAEIAGALGTGTLATTSLAWGDVDGDGDLDLAVGNAGSGNLLYRNETGTLVEEVDALRSDVKMTTSLAWADVDGDGDLDLSVGNWDDLNLIHRNQGGNGLIWVPGALGAGTPQTRSVAWGDMDSDGDLDLAVANSAQVNRLYRNEGWGIFREVPGALGSHQWASTSLAWGDIDGDRDLDLAVGTNCTLGPRFNQLFRNDGGAFVDLGDALGSDCLKTQDLAWGDMDGDGDLDLAVANKDAPNQLYENDGQGVFAEVPLGLGPYARNTTSLAWGDMDGDGDVDLAMGNYGDVNEIYRNVGGGQFVEVGEALGPDARDTQSIAWGDMDGDGDLDLAIGNFLDINQVYRNEGDGVFTDLPGALGVTVAATAVVAWGDADGDADLDLAVGNEGGINMVYRNEGDGVFAYLDRALGLAGTQTYSLAWGDMDGDGDLDLVTGNHQQPLLLFRNGRQGEQPLSNNLGSVEVRAPYPASADFYASATILDEQVIPIPCGFFDPEGDPIGRVDAFYSPDGGGRWHTAIGEVQGTPGTQSSSLGTGHLVSFVADDDLPGAIPDTDTMTRGLTITDAYEIADLDVWVAIIHPNVADLDVYLQSPSGTTVELFSDVGDAGENFDYTLFSDQAQTPIVSGTAPFTGTYQPEGSLVDFAGEMTQGTWNLTVIDDTASNQGTLSAWGLRVRTPPAPHVFAWDTFASGFFGQSDNVVLRLEAYAQQADSGVPGSYLYPNSAPGPFQRPFATATTLPFRVRGTQIQVYTDSIGEGNELAGAAVYRLPAGQTSGGELLADASGRPLHTDAHGYLQGRGEVGLGDQLVAMVPVSATGYYTLYHTSATPSETGLLAHTVSEPGVQELVVSASNPLLLFNLDVSLEWDARYDEQFLSQFEYDLQRTSELLYDWTNGQVALGPVTIYQDRDRWLDAHIRVYASNRLRPSAAQGGIVTDVFTDPTTSDIAYYPGQVRMGAVWNRFGEPEANLGEDWPRALAHELGHYALFLDDNYLGFDATGLLVPVETCTGTAMTDPYRDDYSEFHATDDWLPGCQNTLSNQLTGRSDWQTITAIYGSLDEEPANSGPSGLPLAVTQIRVVEPATPSTALDVPIFYLTQDGHRVQPGGSARAFLFEGDWLTDLGRPTIDYVLARGASVGDRLCVYEPAAGRLGCEVIAPGDEQLALVAVPGWQPEVIISPVTSSTISVSVTNVPAGVELLWARLFPATDPAPPALNLEKTGGQYVGTFTLTQPAPEGYVQIWVDASDPPQGLEEIIADYNLGGNPACIRGRRANIRGRRAPAISADGQVILFAEDLELDEEQFYTLQTATALPEPPPWATVVGQAYRLTASTNAPNLESASLSFLYMGDEVPPGEEEWLRLYFWDGHAWQPLPTDLDTYQNYAVAAVQGEGLYALMSTLEIPLDGPGWNLFSYPMRTTRPVTEALLSITGIYTTVYGYEAPGTADPWKVFDVTAPGWVNDLEVLEFGHGYWINVSQPITLYLHGNGGSTASIDSSLPTPPATYYGQILGGGSFTPEPGMVVTARVEGRACGHTQAREEDGAMVYAVDVLADDGGEGAGCGVPGRAVTFSVESVAMETTAVWSNEQLHPLALKAVSQHMVYLPLIHRSR